MPTFIADVRAPLTGTSYEMTVDASDEDAARDQLEGRGLTVSKLSAAHADTVAEPVGEEAVRRLQAEVRKLRSRVLELEHRKVGAVGAAIAGIVGVVVAGILLSFIRGSL